ncbi:hypothetical protein ACOME3_005714 [Neoechinorhynchus agilis]
MFRVRHVIVRFAAGKWVRRGPHEIRPDHEFNESIAFTIDSHKRHDERLLTSRYRLRRERDVTKWLLPQKSLRLRSKRSSDIPHGDLIDPYASRHHKCILCKFRIPLDYKNVSLLSQFVSPQTGLVYSQSITGLCIYKQEQLENAIALSKSCGLMPHRYKPSRYHYQPDLFDPMKANLRDTMLQIKTNAQSIDAPDPDPENEDKHVTDTPFTPFYKK